jgi:hypothetical protein
MKKIVHWVLSLFATSTAMANEVAPTPNMLAQAEQMIKLEYPDDDARSYEGAYPVDSGFARCSV